MLGGPDAIAWGNVKVGHIDTGYTRHPAFGFPNAPWLDVANGRSFVPPPEQNDPSSFLPTEPGAGEDSCLGAFGGHGTRTGSTICGFDPGAAGGPFYGVAPKVPFIPVRITDSVWINHAQREFKQAVDHLLEQQVSVISVSLGCS